MNCQGRNDFDDQLRDLAPPVAPREDFEQGLRKTLRRSMASRHPGRPLLPIIVILCLGVLFLPGHQDEVNSTEFKLQPHEAIITGERLVQSFRRDIPVSSDPSIRGTDLEAGAALGTTSRERLVGVTGWTFDDHTVFITTYAYQHAGKEQTISRMSRWPPSTPGLHLLEFLLAHGEEILAQAGSRDAENIGCVDRLIDTVPIRFTRRRITWSGWERLIYWQGQPLSP